jgi:hypothetical protein
MSKTKNGLSKFSLKLDHNRVGPVKLDGRKLSGVQSVKFEVSADNHFPPKVVMEIYVSSIKIEVDGVHVKMIGNDVDLSDTEF